MTKILTAAAAALVTLSAAAPAAETTRFTRDGVTYVYTTTHQGDATILAGRSVTDGSPFELTVRGTRVTGIVDRQRVAFSIDKPLDAPVELTQR